MASLVEEVSPVRLQFLELCMDSVNLHGLAAWISRLWLVDCCSVRTKGWDVEAVNEDTGGAKEMAVTAKATKLADDLAKRCKEIEMDESIPTRGSKAKGTICR